MRHRSIRVCSSAWLERTPDKGEVGGSSPPRPTNKLYRINTFRLLIYLLSCKHIVHTCAY